MSTGLILFLPIFVLQFGYKMNTSINQYMGYSLIPGWNLGEGVSGKDRSEQSKWVKNLNFQQSPGMIDYFPKIKYQWEYSPGKILLLEHILR